MPNNNASQPRWSPHTDMWLCYVTFWLDYLTYRFQNTLPIKKNIFPTIQTQLYSLCDPRPWDNKDWIWQRAAHCSTFTGYSITLPGKQIYAINISISWPSLDLILSLQRYQAGNGTGQLIGFSCGQHITSAYMEITTPNTGYKTTIPSSLTVSKTKIPITIVKAQMPSSPNQKFRTRDNEWRDQKFSWLRRPR